MQSTRWLRAAAVVALAVALLGTGMVSAGEPAGDPALAWGSGLRSWWRAHGKQIAELASCAVDGFALARCMAGGAVGGAVAAAALGVAALNCLS